MEIAALIMQLMLKFGPAVAKQAKEMFSKDTITDDDWNKLFSKAQEPWVEMSPSDKIK